MTRTPPAESPFDLIAAVLVAGELAFSIATATLILFFRLRFSASSGRLNSHWPVRLLLLLLASLLSASELLRLPLLRRRLPSHLSPRLCTAYFFLSPSLAEPAFFSTLLFLLRSPAASLPFLSAAASAATAALPFLLLSSLFLLLPNSLLLRIGLPEYFLGHAADAFSHRRSKSHRRNPCNVPLFSTVLLAALAAVYVPLFVSAIWNVVAVVINKRLRVRLYALSVTVIAALSVQVAARALAALWTPSSAVSQVLNLAAFAALLFAVVSGEVILVLQPVVDSLVVVVADDKRLRCSGRRAEASGGELV